MFDISAKVRVVVESATLTLTSEQVEVLTEAYSVLLDDVLNRARRVPEDRLQTLQPALDLLAAVAGLTNDHRVQPPEEEKPATPAEPATLGIEILDDPDWLRQKYVDEEMSMHKIADVVGCSSATVNRRLNQHGIPVRSAHAWRRKKLDPLQGQPE